MYFEGVSTVCTCCVSDQYTLYPSKVLLGVFLAGICHILESCLFGVFLIEIRHVQKCTASAHCGNSSRHRAAGGVLKITHAVVTDQ